MGLALAALLLLAVPARAGVETHEASGLRIVSSNEWLQAYDPATSDVAWSRRLRDSGNVTMLPVLPGVWVLVTGRLEAFEPATGKELWERELGGALLWGPEPLLQEGRPPALLYGVKAGAESRLVALAPLDGRELWTASFPLGLAGAQAVGPDVLLQLRSLPAVAPDRGYRRAAPAPADTAPPVMETRLALVDGSTGQVRWDVAPQGDFSAGPWPIGDYVLYEGRGGLLAALALATGAEAWRTTLAGPLTQPPALLPDSKDRVQVQQASTFGLIGLADGRRVWESSLPGELALPASVTGGRVVLASTLPDPQAPPDKPNPSTILVEVDPATGAVTSRQNLPGTAAQILENHGHLFLFTKQTVSEPMLDRRGRVVRNPVKGDVTPRIVEGYTLFEVDDAGPRKLVEGQRDTLIGQAAFEDGLLLYQTRNFPAQAEGQPRIEDAKHPEEPLVLHAVDPLTGLERWAWKTLGPRDRISEGWTSLDGTLYVTVAGDNPVTGAAKTHLIALDPATGLEKWRSPWLSGGSVVPEARSDGLFVLTDLDVGYVLDAETGAVKTSRNLVPVYNWIKTNNLVGVLLLTGAIAFFIFAARRRDLFIRRIAGLSALDEAVGRATEMGKPVLYVPGLADVDDIQTLASLSILGHVARRTAEYDTPILVPNCRSVVMSMAQEVVKEAYTAVGRPDAFNRDNVRYLSDEQFGFVAGVNGMQMRDRPAANFYMGTFFAESLLLAETGNATGAIQIAGTASASQLPFFVAACDYTLIGEELYAASAYLSKDPMQVGSLKGQDAAKAVLMASILIGTVLFTLGLTWVKELFATS